MQLLPLITLLTCNVCIVSSFHSIYKCGVTPVQLQWYRKPHHQVRSTHRKTSTIRYERNSRRMITLQMGYKSPDEKNNYNDDAFGLVFLASTFEGSADFAGTFLGGSVVWWRRFPSVAWVCTRRPCVRRLCGVARQ